jgi:RNA polymerase sigma factor (sigma-70 family)
MLCLLVVRRLSLSFISQGGVFAASGRSSTLSPHQEYLRALSADSDAVLLERYRQGDEEAAAKLYYRYAGRLRALARSQCPADLAARLDADDIVQTAFSSFFRRVAAGEYRSPGEDVWKLLVLITLHKARSLGGYHRARKRDVRVTDRGSGLLARAALRRQEEQSIADLRLLLEDVLERLPDQHRRVAQLRLQGFEVNEIVQQVGLSKRSVERVLQELRRDLREQLEDCDA